MKKFISILMLAIMLVSLSSIGVCAKEKTKSDDLKLEELGVPTELLEMMPNEQKKDILKQKLKFKSYEKMSLKDLESNAEYDSEDFISIEGTIPSADLDFYISTYQQYPYTNTDKRVRVYINYDWAVVPNFTLTDPYGMAWDDEIWRPVDDTALNYTYWKLENGTVKYEKDDVLAYSDADGAGWNTDIKYAYGLYYVLDNYGWAGITLEAKDPSDAGTSQIHANYTHVYGVGSIGLAFKAVSVSYTGGASADSRGTYKTFTY